jgi:hypothetical protein
MANLKYVTAMVIDYGTNIPLAMKLAESYQRVLLYIPFEEAYPTHYKYHIGVGIPGIERVYNIWDYYNEVDIFIFPHLFQGPFQKWLREQGKLVFGAGMGEDFEIYRDRFKLIQKELGMDLNEYVVLYGLNSLVEYLKNNNDKYVKNNMFRRTMETWQHETYELSKPFLDDLRAEYGMYQDEEIFIVEEPIKDALEYGFDGFCVRGEYPEKTMFGIEVKDQSYCCVFTDYKNLPKPILDANKKLAPKFEEVDYLGWYSNEMRAFTRDRAVLTDMTTRAAEPPTCLALEMLKDYPQYVWDVANGTVPNVRSKYKYGCQLIIVSDWAKKEPQAIYFPQQLKSYVKIKHLTIQDGTYYYVPQGDELTQIGAVIGMGETLKAAIQQAKDIAKEVKGYGLKIDSGCLDDAQEEIDKAKKFGINLF